MAALHHSSDELFYSSGTLLLHVPWSSESSSAPEELMSWIEKSDLAGTAPLAELNVERKAPTALTVFLVEGMAHKPVVDKRDG
jgi:hypothetical protein